MSLILYSQMIMVSGFKSKLYPQTQSDNYNVVFLIRCLHGKLHETRECDNA